MRCCLGEMVTEPVEVTISPGYVITYSGTPKNRSKQNAPHGANPKVAQVVSTQ